MNEKYDPPLESRIEDLYAKGYEGGATWQHAHETRRAFIEDVTREMSGSIDVLDIGCGDGRNTSWIAEKEGNSWVGVDVVDQETLGLTVPKNGKYIRANFLDDTVFVKENLSHHKFNLIVDQGAVLGDLAQIDAIKKYIQRVYSLLEDGGIYVALVPKEDDRERDMYNIRSLQLPDGRVRAMFSEKIFDSEPFSSLFEKVVSETTNYGPSDQVNPFSRVAGNSRGISVIQLALKKK